MYDVDGIAAMVEQAKNVTDRPTIIQLTSIIGKGAPTKAGTAKVHGEPLGPEEAAGAKKAIGVPGRLPVLRVSRGAGVLPGEAAGLEDALRAVEEDPGGMEGGKPRACRGVGEGLQPSRLRSFRRRDARVQGR